LTPDVLDEWERLVAVERDFLRFGRNATGARDDSTGARANCTGATGDDCSGATGADSGCSVGGDGRAVTKPRGSRWLFTRARPKASLNIPPYQSMTASAACNHGCGARSFDLIADSVEAFTVDPFVISQRLHNR
jgi:hypothetical protein